MMKLNNIVKAPNIEGKSLICFFCGYDEFEVIATSLYSRLKNASLFLSMFELAFNRKVLGTAYICNKCGFKHEFFKALPETRSERTKEIFKI